MTKRTVIELYENLSESQKKRAAQQISSILDTQVQYKQIPRHLTNSRVFKKDLERISQYLQQTFPQKSLKPIITGNKKYSDIVSHVSSFLKLNQLGSVSEASTGAYKNIQRTIPNLQQVKPQSISDPVRFFTKLSKFKGLKTLNLVKTDLSNVSYDLTRSSISGLNNLKYLVLQDIRPDSYVSHIVSCISSLHKIELLNLGLNHLTMDNMTELKNTFTHTPRLRDLILQQCHINDEGVVVLSEGLRSLEQLKNLYLQNNFISNIGAIAVADATKHLKHIRAIDIGGNVRDDGVIAMCQSYADRDINVVNIGNNISDTGAFQIASMMQTKWKKVSHLSVGRDIGPIGIMSMAPYFTGSLVDIELQGNRLDINSMNVLAISLKNVPNLRELNLSGTEMNQNMAQILSGALKYIPKLEEFYIGYNMNIGPNGAISLSENIHHLTKLTDVSFRNIGMNDASARTLALALAPVADQLKSIDFMNNQLRQTTFNALHWMFPIMR